MGWLQSSQNHPHADAHWVTSQGQAPCWCPPSNLLQGQKAHIFLMILRNCMFAWYEWKKNEFHRAVNRWQKITIIYQVALGFRKQPGIQRHRILFKKYIFYILLLHNTSCSSWKHKTCYYFLLLFVFAHVTTWNTHLIYDFRMHLRDFSFRC